MNRRLLPLFPVLVFGLWLGMGARSATAQKAEVSAAGSLSASDSNPESGAVLFLYLNVTSLADSASLTLEFKLPTGLVAEPGQGVVKSFGPVKSGETVTLAMKVRSLQTKPKTVLAIATLNDTPELRLSRTFLLTLNPDADGRGNAAAGTNGNGEPLIIFPSRR